MQEKSSYDLFQVSGPGFCAGLILKDFNYCRAAPIIRGAVGICKSYRAFRAYALKRGWTLVHVSTWQEED